MKDWHTHVFTSTYTADVSGVCSMLYELGGMTVLHDPSGCNSTYTTHDEPRWYDSKSLMFISGLDEMTAVLGDDSVLIKDVVKAAEDLKPRFITLCGASIPHIIAFDYRGAAKLIEKETGIPVLPVATDGLRSYISGCGLAMKAWIRRFGNKQAEKIPGRVNIFGVTPIDFSRSENAEAMRRAFEAEGFSVRIFAMNETFEALQEVYQAECNIVVSAAGRSPAQYLWKTAGIPYVEGLPSGKDMSSRQSSISSLCRSKRETASETQKAGRISNPSCFRDKASPSVMIRSSSARSIIKPPHASPRIFSITEPVIFFTARSSSTYTTINDNRITAARGRTGKLIA